jgi:hypothetical protein
LRRSKPLFYTDDYHEAVQVWSDPNPFFKKRRANQLPGSENETLKITTKSIIQDTGRRVSAHEIKTHKKPTSKSKATTKLK